MERGVLTPLIFYFTTYFSRYCILKFVSSKKALLIEDKIIRGLDLQNYPLHLFLPFLIVYAC